MTPIHIYAPDGNVGVAARALATAPAGLAGCKLLVLDNGKPGAEVLLGHAAERIAQRTGALYLGSRRKGSAATPCEPELLHELEAEADLILTGTAD
ncbi:MAG: hypothetical protein JRH16_14110 [Deltaproteobacteria bacterium]|nr:hypothetical protein [Deltaproteobacteria bacterium]MBW2359745.1 hypothetical protein [Deltaproteobacteria bacterium]